MLGYEYAGLLLVRLSAEKIFFSPNNLLLKSFYLSFFFFSCCPGGTSSTYVLQLFHMEHALYFYLFSEVFYALYKTGTICTFYLNIYKIKVNTTF